jgi:hypothetical protein
VISTPGSTKLYYKDGRATYQDLAEASERDAEEDNLLKLDDVILLTEASLNEWCQEKNV